MKKPIAAPTKEQIREYMTGREKSSAPPPSPEQVRQELGWHLKNKLM